MNDLRTLPLSSLLLSQTRAQLERRAHFDAAAIAELAESIKTVGLLQPLVVRTTQLADNCGELFEIVAGERRYLAAEQAGLAEIPCSVRELTDEQVLEVQLIENLQRADLHPLIEAEGYEGLQQLGHGIEEIAAKVGKSERTIYARMQLLQLCPEARKLAHLGKLTPSTALLVARIRPDDRQLEAAREVAGINEDGTDDGHGPMSYRQARDFVRREYMLALGSAPFDQASDELVPGAGSCSACPKRTGNNPDLFGDVDAADVCTDPPCFDSKVQAHGALLLALAKKQGRKVITGEEAEEIVEFEREGELGGVVHLSYDYAQLDDKCYQDPKGRTYKELLGDSAKPAVLQTPAGNILEVIEVKKAYEQLKKSGVIDEPKRPRTKPKPNPANQKAELDRKRAERLSARIFREIFRASGDTLREAAEHLVRDNLAAMGNGPEVFKALGWDAYHGNSIEKFLEKLPAPNLARLMHVLPYQEDLGGLYGGEPTKHLLDRAKVLKIGVAQIKEEVDAELAPKASPAPAAKKAAKKAPRKPK